MHSKTAGHQADERELREVVARAVGAHAQRAAPLLEILHTVQGELGYVPAEAVPLIAHALNLSRAEVHGTATFYHHFRHAPPGRHLLQICQAEACKSMQGERLTAYAKQRLNIELHQTSADGEFTLEPVYCLGNCACAPALMLDGELYGRVDEQRFETLIDQARTDGRKTPE